VKQDPRGPRDFYAPPGSPSAPPPSGWSRATRVLALLYVAGAAATILFSVATVESVVGGSSGDAWSREWVEIGMRGGLSASVGFGWLLSFAAFQVRREEGAWALGVFVLGSGLATGGLFALVSLPVAGPGSEL